MELADGRGRIVTRARDVLARLVAALPACDRCCDGPATKAWRRGEGRWCDGCVPPGCPDYPRAAPLREAMALLAESVAETLERRLENALCAVVRYTRAAIGANELATLEPRIRDRVIEAWQEATDVIRDVREAMALLAEPVVPSSPDAWRVLTEPASKPRPTAEQIARITERAQREQRAVERMSEAASEAWPDEATLVEWEQLAGLWALDDSETYPRRVARALCAAVAALRQTRAAEQTWRVSTEGALAMLKTAQRERDEARAEAKAAEAVVWAAESYLEVQGGPGEDEARQALCDALAAYGGRCG